MQYLFLLGSLYLIQNTPNITNVPVNQLNSLLGGNSYFTFSNPTVGSVGAVGPVTPVAQAFRNYRIVPNIIPYAPNKIVEVNYPSGVNVNLGTLTQPRFVRSHPIVKWEPRNRNTFHTVIMIDPDAGEVSEVKHWMIGNIPGNDVSRGTVIADYVGSAPPVGTGLHRYIFLVYEQPWGPINFNEPYTSSRDFNFRPFFRINKFVRKYELGRPIAGNFFFAGWDESVLGLRTRLGLT